jgi:hypothetical protein
MDILANINITRLFLINISIILSLFILLIIYQIKTSKKRFISKIVKKYFYYIKKDFSVEKIYFEILKDFCPPDQRRLTFYTFGKVSDDISSSSEYTDELFLEEDGVEVKKLKYLIMTIIVAKQRNSLSPEQVSFYNSLINRIYKNVAPKYGS